MDDGYAQEQDEQGDEGMGEGQGEVTVSRCHLCRGLKELRSAVHWYPGKCLKPSE